MDTKRTSANEKLLDFYGIENHYRHGLTGKLYTDGIVALAKEWECYWLLDKIFSLQLEKAIRDVDFQVWYLSRIEETNSFKLILDDGNSVIKYEEVIDFSDFKDDDLKLYYIDGVLLLPSEY